MGGDFNAKPGSLQEGECHEIIGAYGMGQRNERGEKMVKWAWMNDLSICNTMFKKLPEKRWTHIWHGEKRQIDFSLAK